MKASDLLVRCLEEEGIEYVFGVPGEENADFLISLKDSSIRFILTRHEQGAAFMAEVYGRLTGNPAVCMATLGPGATNLITGVADANMDRAPLLALTGQAATTRQHKESHQVMDVVSMYDPVTKWSRSIESADTIPELVRKAVRMARGEKPGAAHLELPEDVAKQTTDMKPMKPRRFRRPVPDDHIGDRAWEWIRKSSRPIILAGNGAIRKRASKQLRLFCEATGIGVVSTFMAKGCVDMDAPYCLYTIGLQQRDFPAIAVEESDLVLAVGYDLVEYPPRLWNPSGDKPIIHCDFDPAEIDNRYDPAVEMVGDVAHALWMLGQRVARDGPPAFDLGYQHDLRGKMQAELCRHAADDATGLIKPQKALWDVRQCLGPEDILLSGVGAHKMWIGRHYQCHEPNTCIIPNGFCSMGLPLPGAIAAHLVSPRRKVLAVTGDGDFLMNVQEMETARRLDADITVMVWVDGGYGLISWKQQQECGQTTDLSFGNPDWEKLAASFGWQGTYVERSADLAPALRAALAHRGPSLLALPIDYGENVKLSQRLGRLHMTL